jgi:hypothetical protein
VSIRFRASRASNGLGRKSLSAIRRRFSGAVPRDAQEAYPFGTLPVSR